MVKEDLGEATLVYEGPDGASEELTVENEHVAYFQDHWIVKTDDGEAEHDTIRRIPASRVYHVERDVEEFEAEVSTMLDEVQSVAGGVEQELQTVRDRIGSVADEVQTGLLGGRRRSDSSEENDTDVVHIDVATGATRSGSEDDDHDGSRETTGSSEDTGDSVDGDESPAS